MALKGKNTILIEFQIFFQRIQMAEEDIRYLGRLFWFFLIPEDWSQEKRLRLVSNIPKNMAVAAVCGWRRRKKVRGGCANQ